MAFDVQAALKAGYSPADIADYLGSKSNFDVDAARKAGYKDDEITAHLLEVQPKASPQKPLPEGVTPSEGRSATPMGKPDPRLIKPEDDRTIMQRVKDFVNPEYKSVLETAAEPPTPVERQAEIDKRLSYGAGPISKETLGQADLVRGGLAQTEDPRVQQIAQEMANRGETGVGGLIARATRPENAAAARDAKAEEFRTPGQWAVDTLISAPAQFGASFLSLPVNIIAPSSGIADTLREAQKDFKDLESDQLKARQARMAERVNKEDGFINQYTTVVGELVSSPSLTLQETVKQAGYFLGVLGLAKAGYTAAGGLVNLAGRASPTLALAEAISGGAIKTGAQIAGAAVGGRTASMLMAGGDAAGATYETLTDPNKTPIKEWQKNEDYQRLVSGGMSSENAIKEIATTKARIAAAIVAPLGLFGYAGAEAAIVSRGIAKSLSQRLAAQNAGKIFGKELVGENIEEMGTQLGGNIVTQTVNPNQNLLEGVAEAGATATVTSGPFAALAARNEFKGGQTPPPVDPYSDASARYLLNPNTYDSQLISPLQTVDPSKVLQAKTVDDAIASADDLAGSVSFTPSPTPDLTGVIPPTPDLTGVIPPTPDLTGRIEPTLDMQTPTVELPAPNPVTEQQFGLDKLRLAPVGVPSENAPATAADKTLDIPGETLPSAATAPVGGESAATAARAAAQNSLDRWAAANNVDTPAVFNPATPEMDSAINDIAQALHSKFNARLYAYNDNRADALNGVAIGGAAFVNTGSVDINAARTSLHEFHHTIEQIAALEARQGQTDTEAQKYVASMNSIFDGMTDAGKQAYITNFLHKDELAGIADPVAREQRVQELIAAPQTRSEMVADFLGNRATDKKFWKDVAAADPQGFKGFVDKWIGIVDNLIDTLKGTKTQGRKESARVDKYVSDLNAAKVVARDALVNYSKGIQNGSINQGVSEFAASDRQVVGGDGGGEAPSYGTPREGAVSLIGRHYSTEARTSLNGAYYGRGLKGAERDRLDSSPDPRLKNRVYFYVDQGQGIRPESGVGGIAHETKLDNIYDPKTGLIPVKGNFNAFESAVLNAGFDGYVAPFGNNQSAVVLLGPRHSAVPVRPLGRVAGAPAPIAAEPTTLKKGLLSKEVAAIQASRIPGARLASGNLEIPVASREAANAELERIGSGARFSKPQKGEPLSKAVKAEGARATAIVSSKPGREFKVGDETVNIVKYPEAKDLEFVTSRLHARVRDVLTGSDAINFLAESFALKGPSFKNPTTIRGLWAGEREDTFAVVAANADGSPASFENSRKLANLLGFGFIQEGTVTIEPSHKNNTGIPAVLIGKPNGVKLTRLEIDSALSAANAAGFFGASEALSGAGIKFLFFADDSSNKSTQEQYRDFVDQVGRVQQSTGLTAAGNFNTNSELDGANDYWTNATKPLSADLSGAGDQTLAGGSPDLFRGTVDNLLAPYISAITTEGFEFDVSQWQRVFGATDAQTAYLKLKVAELDNINKHGVVPKLRQRVPITNLKQVGSRALLTQKTTEANAAEQLDVLDRVLAASSNPVKSTEAWLRMEAMAYGTNDVPMAPNRFIQMYNSDGIYEQLKGLSPGQVSDAQHGAEMGQEFRRLYESGKVKPEITAKLMLWSFLSRGVSPFVQESAFVDLVDKIDPFIPRVLDGTFSDDDANAWNKIVSETIKKGTGQPGAGTTHNANAFGASFMRGMAAPAPNGQTKMQYLHGLFSDPSKSGSEIRREFVKIGEGVGIDNKVISFTLLVIGHDDVAVLDRVQIANTYNDGRLGDYNLYDGIARYGYKDKGKMVWVGSTEGDYATAQEQAPDGEVISAKVPGSGMANLTTGARGLMIYEPLESALQKVLPGIFDRLKADGLRSQNTRATVGRWHWESWVAYSGQEASHKTLEALLAEAKGAKNPFSDVSAKEGEYGAFSYGTEYARDASGKAYKLYHDSTGKAYRFTLDSYKELMSEIKKKGKDGVVPTSFRVSTNEDGTQRSKPWFKDPRVDLTKFDEAIHRLGASPNISASKRQGESTVAIFEGLGKRGLAKAKAETALRNHPNAAKMQYIQNNFLDILDELDSSGLVDINCK